MKIIRLAFRRYVTGLALCVLLGSSLVVASCGYFESDQARLEKARQLYKENKFSQSIVIVKKILQSDPKSCPARVLLGQNQFAKYSLLDVQETMNKAKQQGCADAAVFVTYFKSLLYQNELAHAEKLINDPAFKHMNDSPQGHLLKGDLYSLRGDPKRAETEYLAFSSSADSKTGECLSRVKLLSLKNESSNVIAMADKCENLSSDENLKNLSIQADYLKAVAQLKEGKISESKKTLSEIIHAYPDPKDPNIRIQSALLLMKLYVAEKKITEASSLADILLGYVAAPEIFHVKGLKAEQDNRYDLAERQFLNALKLNSNYQPSLLEMANIKYKEGNLEQARYYTGRMDALSDNGKYTQHLDELLAIKDLKIGNLDSVINNLGNDKKGQSEKSLYILALAYAKKGESAKARQVFQSVQNKITDAAHKDLLEAKLDLELGDYNSAEALFKKHSSSGNIYAIAGLAEVYMRQKRYADAERFLHSSLAQDKNAYYVTALLVGLYRTTHSYDKAIQLLNSQIDGASIKYKYQLLLAETQFRFGKYRDSAAVCKVILKSDPDNINARMLSANANIRLSQLELAKKELEIVIKRQPANIDAYLMLAVVAQKSGDHQGAIDRADEALKIDPLNLKIIYTKLNILLAQHANKDAIEFATLKASSIKDVIAASLLLARAYDGAGDANRAYDNYRKAINNGLRDIRVALLSYAVSADINGKAKAEAELDDFLAANPSIGNIYIAANYFMKRNDYAFAEKYYQEYVDKNQQNPAAYNNLAWLKYRNGKAKVALEYAQQALALEPDSPQIQDTLGWVLLGNGQIDKGGDYLQKAYAKIGDDPSVKYHLAMYYWKNNQTEQSVKLLEEVKGSRFPEQDEAAKLLSQLTAIKK